MLAKWWDTKRSLKFQILPTFWYLWFLPTHKW